MANKLGKLDKKQISAFGSALVIAAKVAHEAWEAINKDDRASVALKDLIAKVRETAKVKRPQARLLTQLDLIDEYALKAAAHPQAATVATRWLQESSAIREKLPLVDALPGRAGKKKLADLRQRASELLAEIITSDLAPDSPVDPLA